MYQIMFHIKANAKRNYCLKTVHVAKGLSVSLRVASFHNPNLQRRQRLTRVMTGLMCCGTVRSGQGTRSRARAHNQASTAWGPSCRAHEEDKYDVRVSVGASIPREDSTPTFQSFEQQGSELTHHRFSVFHSMKIKIGP